MQAGYEVIIDAVGCAPEQLRCLDTLRALCEQIVADLQLHVVGTPQWHPFPEPGGVTGMYLLSESHLTCHTFPEFQLATFNLYCCRPHGEWNWPTQLGKWLGARRVEVRCLERGLAVPESFVTSAHHEELP